MKFQIYRDRKKEWRWRLLAVNGKKIANSGEGYRRKGTMIRSMNRIIWGIREGRFTSEAK